MHIFLFMVFAQHATHTRRQLGSTHSFLLTTTLIEIEMYNLLTTRRNEYENGNGVIIFVLCKTVQIFKLQEAWKTEDEYPQDVITSGNV